MVHPDSMENAVQSTILSLILGIVAFFVDNMDVVIRLIVAVGSIVTAVFACRYYHIAIKEKKESLKKLRAENALINDKTD